jgi:hypothetical protein
VERPAFGGLNYQTLLSMLRGLAARGRLAGVDVVGLVPERDSAGLTAQLGARLAVVTLGVLAHAGRLGQAVRQPVPLSVAARPSPRRGVRPL